MLEPGSSIAGSCATLATRRRAIRRREAHLSPNLCQRCQRGDAANKAAGGKAVGAQMCKADVEETHNVCSSKDSWQEGPWWEAVAFLADAHPQGGYKEILEEHFKRERKEQDEGVARWLGIIA